MPPRRAPKNWRDRPITKKQLYRLKKEGLTFHETMTQGEASDLIGTKIKPSAEELYTLKYFKIKGIKSFNQTTARKTIESLLAEPIKLEKWENRPAEKSQLDLYEFFNISIPTTLSWREANEKIEEIKKDPARLQAWEAHEGKLAELEDAAFERAEWISETLVDMNEYAKIYEEPRLTKRLFIEVIEKLEARGMNLDAIADSDEIVFKTAHQIDPTRKKPFEFYTSSNYSHAKSHRTPNSTSWILATVAIGFLIFWVFVK